MLAAGVVAAVAPAVPVEAVVAAVLVVAAFDVVGVALA